MATGLNALQSILGRLKNSTPRQGLISVLTFEYDLLNGEPIVNWPADLDRVSKGILIVPPPMSESEWESQFEDEWEAQFEDEWEAQFED